MNTQLETIRSELLSQLESIKDSNSPESLKVAMRLIDNALTKMRMLVKERTFFKIIDEIMYFKELRPRMLALKIETALKYSLMINMPIKTANGQIDYYEEALKGLQSFLELNAFYYQYYKNGFKELDTLYFVRNAGPLTVPIYETPDVDVESAAPVSDLFARFMAYESVQRFILKQVKLLMNQDTPSENVFRTAEELQWTGDVVNLVEVAYGIWLTGQINHGNASLNQIIRWLEANLAVDVGIVQKKFTEISRRKRLSVTRFIDQMKNAILRKIDNSNEN